MAGKSHGTVLLSGGNPQIAKGFGDAPVQAYIAAMPGWTRDVGRRLDALIVQTVPGVSKAVKWNTPLYGVESGHWFLSFHVFAKYIKVGFFRGAELEPPPPVASKQKDGSLPAHSRGRRARRRPVRRTGSSRQAGCRASRCRALAAARRLPGQKGEGCHLSGK